MKRRYIKRKYKFDIRLLDGIQSYISSGWDVSNAASKFHYRMKRRYGISSAELSSITAKVSIWNPKTQRWNKPKPWWIEEKKLYPWER